MVTGMKIPETRARPPMRRISFKLTQEQIRRRTKTVTRREGWEDAKPGEVLLGVDQVQGLKKGQKPVELAVIELISVRREPLDALLDRAVYSEDAAQADVAAEGFPMKTPDMFVRHFCGAMGVEPSVLITRLEFKYPEPADAMLALIRSRPRRTCKSLHHCFLCGQAILLGQEYYDGGYGHRAHVECGLGESPPSPTLIIGKEIAHMDRAQEEATIPSGAAPTEPAEPAQPAPPELTLADLPRLPNWLAEHDLAIFDLETTGPEPETARITQAAIMHVNRGCVVGEWWSNVNPGVPIPEDVSRLTGITDADVARAPTFADLYTEIAWRLGFRGPPRLLVAFNGRHFDAPVLAAECARAGKSPLVGRVIDPIIVVHDFDQFQKGHTLTAACERHRVPIERAHNALGDVRMAYGLLLRLARQYERQYSITLLEQLWPWQEQKAAAQETAYRARKDAEARAATRNAT